MAPNEVESLVKDLQPGPHVEEFANALDNCLAPGLSLSEKRARVLDLPRKYHENAIRRLIQKRPKRARDGYEDVYMDVDDNDAVDPDSKVLDEVSQLEKEIQTWDLVRRLLPLRCAETQPTKPLFSIAPTAKKDGPHDPDPTLLERRAVLQWLQTNAASGPDIDELARELQQNADRGDIIAHGWLHTRSAIKLRKSMTAWPHLLDRQSPTVAASHVNSDGAPLVTQLDPDAGTRQGRKLEPQDDYFERAIWLGCFEHLRRGSSLQTIREWCQERTEMWRAVSMSGMLLPADGQESSADVRPASIVLWRRMCLGLARGGGADDYERAVYGLLAGDIASVEKVAKSWDDFLFANYNALLRTQMDSRFLSQSPPDTVSVLTQSFSSFDAIQFHGDAEGVEKRLVAALESQKSTRDEALEPNKALQASIIARDVDRHLYEQAFVLTEDANQHRPSSLLPPLHPSAWKFSRDKGEVIRAKFFGLEEHEGLRVICHVYLLMALLRQLDTLEGKVVHDQLTLSHWRSGQENIMAAYTFYLARANLMELIPLYCSILKSPRRYDVLSWNMIHEENADRRMTQLKLIKRVGIDVLEFVETMAKLAYDKLDHANDSFAAKKSFSIVGEGPPTVWQGRGIKPDFFGDDEAVMTREDEHAIRSLEWLLQVQVAWPEVLRIGVLVYKFFFRNAHILAARRLMERVQFEAILQNVSAQEIDLGMLDDVDFWAQQLDQCGNARAVPEQVMVDARNYRELEYLARALDSLETMGSLIELSKEGASGERKFWSGVGDAVKAMKDRMQPLLGSWLLTSIQAGDKKLGELRQVYLPEAILAFVSGLHYAGTKLSRDNLLECMELASTVAERESNLAAAFVEAKRMRELVEALTACSKALATGMGNKGVAGSSSKKLRETGWSRDLWTVKQ